MQPNSGNQRHHVSRAIDVYWILFVSGVHRVYWQWDGEGAFHCIDNDREWVCDIQCPKRRVVFWSWKWGEKGGILIVKVRTRRSMDLVGLQVQTISIHTYPDWSVPRIVLCTIRMVRPYLMWRTIKVCDVMQTSIYTMSNRTGNWVPRTTDLSWSLS